MDIDQRKLKITSDETKNFIDKLEIVTPSIYASIFSKFASNNNMEMQNEKELSNELLSQEYSNLIDMQDNTVKSATRLNDNTIKAIGAIQTNDEAILNLVLKETEILRQEIKKLKESVYKDQLTNANNRKHLHDHHLAENSELFRDAGTLAIIDLNYFKIINDTHGHITGDKILIYIANQLKRTNHDVIRYGGDEFLIIFSKEISAKQAISTLDEMRKSISKKKFRSQDASFRISFSLGTVSFSKGEHLSKVIEQADKNMYEDKIKIKQKIKGIIA